MAPFIINSYYVLASSQNAYLTDDLVFFVDAQQGIYNNAGTTLALDGETIQQINDQSDSGLEAINTNSGSQATYQVASVNGLNSLRLEIDSEASTYFLSSDINITDSFTIYWVYKKDATAETAVILATAANKEITDQANGFNYFLEGNTNAEFNGADNWTVASVVIDPDFFSYYVNGVLIRRAVSASPASQVIDRLFQRPSFRAGNYNVADILIYNATQSLEDVAFTFEEINKKYQELYLETDITLPTPPEVGTTELEWYHNPDYNSYTDIAITSANDLEFVRASKITSGDLSSMRQHTASRQMQYKTNSLPNGKASFFKGGGDYMEMSEAKVFTASESFVAYSVHKRGSTTGTNAIFGKEGDFDNAIMDWASNIVYYKALTGTATVSGMPNSLDTVVRAYVVNRTAQTFTVYQNGVEIGSASTAAITADTTFDLMFNRFTNGTGAVDHGITLLYRGLHDGTDVVTVSDWLNDYYGDKIYEHPPITSDLELYVNPDIGVYSDDVGTVAVDGDNIRQVNDRSTNGVVLDQSTASSQFVYAKDHFGTGLSAINSPTGSTQHMDFTSTITIPGATKSLTFYTVYDKTNTSGISYLFGTTDNNFNRILEYNNHSIYFQDTDGDTHFTSIANTTGLAIRAFTLDTSTDTITTYNNGVLDSSSTLSKTWGDFNFDSFWGGANVSYIGSTLLYSDLHDSTQVEQVSDWLNQKYQVY